MKIIHDPRILKMNLAAFNDPDGFVVILRYAEHPSPVISRSHRDNRQGNFGSRTGSLKETSIYNFIHGAVTADHDEFPITIFDRFRGHLDCITSGRSDLTPE